MEQEPQEVIEAMFEKALRRDPDKLRPWAVLLDRAEKQLDLVLALVLTNRPDASLVLDFIHVPKYVWKAACSFYAVASKEAESWMSQADLRISRSLREGPKASLPKCESVPVTIS